MFAKRIRNLDDPKITEEYHSSLIRTKPFLKNIYVGFYNQFKERINSSKKQKIVELGSGGGFIKEVIPQTITSDIMKLSTIDMQFSALKMPFKNETIDVFLMIDVMHHVPDAKRFLREMKRCLKNNGKIIMIEPANTLWGSFIYKYFHHENYDPQAGWQFNSIGPLSSSNLALPWIVFFRDRKIFNELFPTLAIERITPHTPLLYLLSGGLSFHQLVPTWTYFFFKKIEELLKKSHHYLGLFYTIEIVKKDITSD